MKFEYKTEKKVPDKIENKDSKVLLTLIYFSNTIIENFVPFLFGFYFSVTKSLWFLFLFITLTVFGIEFDYKKGKISFKIKRIF